MTRPFIDRRYLCAMALAAAPISGQPWSFARGAGTSLTIPGTARTKRFGLLPIGSGPGGYTGHDFPTTTELFTRTGGPLTVVTDHTTAPRLPATPDLRSLRRRSGYEPPQGLSCAPALSGSSAPTAPALPDELLTITGLTLTTEQDWSIRLAGMMPIANWDHHAARETFNGSGVSSRRWPLCTLWADSDNWIELSANCEDNKGFRVRVKAGGSLLEPIDFGDGMQIWLPESPLLLGIGHVYSSGPPANRLLYVGASLGGDLVKVGPNGIVVPWSGKTFTKLRFRGATGGTETIPDGEVCEFRWIGGEVNPTSGLNNSTLLSAFADLNFLSGP